MFDYIKDYEDNLIPYFAVQKNERGLSRERKISMDKELSETKLAIILAAGELFAEHGLEGTSIRPIAQKAGVNIAAINYHFGSKENLYTEVLKYALLHNKSETQIRDFFEASEYITKPDEIAQFLSRFIKSRFISFFSPDKPPWFTRLILQSFSVPTSSLREIIEKYFLPEIKALTDIIRRSNPSMTEQKAQFWSLSIQGQMAFYGLCKIPVLILLDKKEYDLEFIEAVADHVACTTITSLGLPQPKE
jgi:AcrR family transcriptional regulator